MDKPDQYNPIFYQYRKPKSKINKFTIIGERHSGTNWLERLLLSRLDLPITWEFGSKHFVNPNPNKLAGGVDTLFVCITRNIYDWIGGFYKLPHHVHVDMLIDIEHFILDEWKSEYKIEDNDYFTLKPYKNIFDLRKSKLQYLYIILPLIVDNLFITRYEDLLTDTEQVIESISTIFDINKTNKKYSRLITSRPKKPYKFTKHTLSIIKNNTDWETEKIFGYESK